MAKTKAKSKKTESASSNGQNGATPSPRVSVLKTYKMYIGGKFPRTESGRFFGLHDGSGNLIANVCRGSRKDFREAVAAARKAQPGWAARAAFNRGQILYRIAEMLEGRTAQFEAELQQTGATAATAKQEVLDSIDRLIYYAGWCDKYQQVFSAVNPVASSHFNFSLPEPTGVVAAFAPEDSGLLGLVSVIAPAIAGGNGLVVLASDQHPTAAISFAEVLHSSDVPGGVVNVLTGHRGELIGHFSTHMDVNALVYTGNDTEQIRTIQDNAALNVKRVILRDEDYRGEDGQSPYHIMDTQETKTTWHPVGGSYGAGGGY